MKKTRFLIALSVAVALGTLVAPGANAGTVTSTAPVTRPSVVRTGQALSSLQAYWTPLRKQEALANNLDSGTRPRSTASAAAAADNRLGVLFLTLSGVNRSCTGSVIPAETNSSNPNAYAVVATAAHCITALVNNKPVIATNLMFKPGLAGSSAPLGTWGTKAISINGAYAPVSVGGSPGAFDNAFVLLSLSGGQNLINITGSFGTEFVSQTTSLPDFFSLVTSANLLYYATNNTQQSCAALPTASTSVDFNWKMPCAGVPSGGSGGPLLVDIPVVNAMSLEVGVISSGDATTAAGGVFDTSNAQPAVEAASPAFGAPVPS